MDPKVKRALTATLSLVRDCLENDEKLAVKLYNLKDNAEPILKMERVFGTRRLHEKLEEISRLNTPQLDTLLSQLKTFSSNSFSYDELLRDRGSLKLYCSSFSGLFDKISRLNDEITSDKKILRDSLVGLGLVSDALSRMDDHDDPYFPSYSSEKSIKERYKTFVGGRELKEVSSESGLYSFIDPAKATQEVAPELPKKSKRSA